MPRQSNNCTEAVIFDLDDTLIDWSERSMSGAEINRRHMGYVYDFLSADGHTLPERDEFLDCFREVVVASWQEAKKTWAGVNFAQVLQDSLVACELDVSQIDLNAVMRAYDWQPMPGVRPYLDARPVLEAIKQRGYKIGLITNSMQPMWMRDVELEAYDILHFFDARVTSGDTGYMKPHPIIYRQLLAQLDVEPQRAVFVGDRPANDIAGANSVGLVSVLMDPPHLQRDLGDVQPDFTITQLRELLPILEKLDKRRQHRMDG